MDPRIDLAHRLETEYARHRLELSVDKPWEGYFSTRQDQRQVAYHLGHRRDPERRIIDWRSPLAEVYYLGAGESFETQARDGYRSLEGLLEHKASVTSDGPRLTRVVITDRDGEHTLDAADNGFALAGTDTPPESTTGLPSLAALLTPEQYKLITRSRARAVIIQGRAGSGKTSVALHRVAWLTYAAADASAQPLSPERALVVMFNRALCEFVRGSLNELGLGAVAINTFHAWALQCIKRAYQGSFEVVAAKGPESAIVAKLKKRIGMLHAIDAYVSAQTKALDAWLAERLKPLGALPWRDRVREDNAPVVRTLVRLRADARRARDLASGAEGRRRGEVVKVFDQAVKRMILYKEDLSRLLTDEALLGQHLGADPEETRQLVTFQRGFFAAERTTERATAKVAWEDLALLLRFIQRKNGGYPLRDTEEPVSLYDHLVIDEAQDFGAVELQTLLSSVRNRTSVTIVGDVNQKIVPEADFVGWSALAETLGVGGAEVAQLEVAHRSTGPIMTLADRLVGDVTVAGRPGPRPRFFREHSESAVFSRVLLLLQELGEQNPDAHVCVVCRHAEEAKEWAERLSHLLDGLLPVRHGYNNTFRFEPGVTVTNYRQVKGLEFETVLVVDPSTENYPDDDTGRRALYVTCTRARNRLDFISAQSPTPMLSVAIEAETIELIDDAKERPETDDSASNETLEPF